MDYRKLDAALAGALDGEDPDRPGEPLSVFLHLDPAAAAGAGARQSLAAYGVLPGSLRGGIATATLSSDQVRELSEQPWVRQIRLSGRLRLLGDE